MLRFIIIVIYVVIYCIIGLPVLLVETVAGRFSKEAKDSIVMSYVKWGLRCVTALSGAKVTYIGEDRVPKDRAVLYIANHRSFFDTILTYQRVPRPTGYMGKKEMEHYPLIRDWMRAAHCVFIDRNDIRQGLKCILECIDDVKNGISICIFPEGTRSRKEGELLPFHEGSFKVATKSGCQIVPIAINNTAALFEDHFPKVRPAHVIIEYCEPIDPGTLTPDEKKHIGSYVEDVIRKTCDKNRPLV